MNRAERLYSHVQELERINNDFASLSGNVNISFEFFPPRSEDMNQVLWQSIKKLEPLQPDFVSVTYGAGAGTRERTHEVIEKIYTETSLNTVPHLTCIDASEAEIEQIAHRYWEIGVRHIVALRGDKPDDSDKHNGDFTYATDLIKKLKSLYDFDISVAAYPEVHPEAESAQSDFENLKQKVDAGASRAITQFFFNAEHFLRLRDKCVRDNVEVDLIPGILPVTNFLQLLKFARFTQVEIPGWMHKLYQGLDQDPITRQLIASHIAIEQVKLLAKEGIKNFHFYTLNRADLTYAICHSLGRRDCFAAAS